MNTKKPFSLGVVEGFFGLAWSWEAREAYTDFLCAYNFNAYLYAPKSDLFLRKQWQQPFPDEHLYRLKNLSAHYANANLDFGIGLSPFELYRDFSSKQQVLLKNKLDEINQINPDTLSILFDDMPGELPDLAERQTEIMHFVCEHSQARNFSLCPSYYSDDPLLAKHFGKMPDNYLQGLGKLLDPDIDIFWTGPKVISPELTVAHLKDVAQRLQRKPLIWDNYPVNDGQQLTNFLHLRPFENRAKELSTVCSGHMANPMNQAFLSQFPLYSLSKLYSGEDVSFEQACQALCSVELGEMLRNDLSLFQELGLDSMSSDLKEKLKAKYDPHKENPMVWELIDWLNNKYIFDPACLT